MAKRSSNANASAQSPMETRSKRAKVDETNAKSPNAQRDVNKPAVDLIHDPKYYFEDGSVTLRVKNILFKLHTSVLKAHSEDFFKQLDSPPSTSNSIAPGGTSDEDAIVIPDIQPSQLRNLIKIVYCLPSNNIVFGQLAPGDNKVAGEFECYLDVAVLSRKFGMEATEQWAKKKLKQLVHNSGKTLVGKIDQLYKGDTTGNSGDTYLGDNHSESDEEVDRKVQEVSYEAYRLFEAIKYARDVSDSPLLQDTLIILEYYFTCQDTDVTSLVSFFRIANLREENSSLFGFIFLLLLSYGNQVWIEKDFTREDRMALFSAQSFLTPFPESFKECALVPLFKKPTRASKFTPILSGHVDNEECESGCYKKVFAQWEKVFSDNYYEDIREKDFSISIKALVTLPSRRLDLAARLREIKCQRCRWNILDQVDEDIQDVFSQVAKYYKAYD